MADTLPCPDGAGSINNPDVPAQQGTNPPLTVVEPCVGEWEISGHDDDVCARNELANQQGYVAEMLNINGAPINIFKLLGVHEQGQGSIVSSGTIFGSTPAPGYPVSGINSPGQAWRSVQTGTSISGAAFVGVDFGISTASTGVADYLPIKPNWKKIGAITIKQGNTATSFARQVRVETTDGSVEFGARSVIGIGNGNVTLLAGERTEEGLVALTFTSDATFTITYKHLNTTTSLGSGTVDVQFNSPQVRILVATGTAAWTAGTIVTIPIWYVWKRQGVYNLIQSAQPVVLNLQKEINAKAVRVVPTLYTGSGNWEISELDVLDSPPTNINNIQDLFFNENRDRDYAKVPIQLKAQYQPSSSITDLSKFGLNILDQYSFNVAFMDMVQKLGRPLVTGDIIEVVPEMQYDHNLKPVRKFLEVTDTGWAAEGFSPAWKPLVYRFAAQQALPSQETRDIFGTMDTQKYLIADSLFNELGVGEQIDTTPLTNTEEIKKAAKEAVPEGGDDLEMVTAGTRMPVPQKAPNEKGNPKPVVPGNAKMSKKVEDGLPPAGLPYGEGYALPDVNTLNASNDGDYFRLYYPSETKIAPRLFKFSIVKNRWIYMETDRRRDTSSHKPSVRSILESNTKQGLKKKQS